MRHTTIIAAALVAALITDTTAASAGDRVSYIDVYGQGRQDEIGVPRNTVADGIGPVERTDPDITLPLVDEEEPPVVGKTPGSVDKPGVPILDPTIVIDFGSYGEVVPSEPVEIKLACVTAAPNGVKIVNVGDAAVPAGIKLRWSFHYAGGKVTLANGLKAGKAVLVEGYEGHSKGKACGIKLLS